MSSCPRCEGSWRDEDVPLVRELLEAGLRGSFQRLAADTCRVWSLVPPLDSLGVLLPRKGSTDCIALDQDRQPARTGRDSKVIDMTSPLAGYKDREDVASALAVLLGHPIQPATISKYVQREGFPAPHTSIGRTPVWLDAQLDDIRAWVAARPGRGSGGGRPRKTPVQPIQPKA